MSIRTRLTVWYVFLLAGILVLFSAGLYALLNYSQMDEVDRTLETRATEIQKSVIASVAIQRDPLIYLSRGGVTLLPSADVFATPGVLVQLSTLDNTPIMHSDNLGSSQLEVPQAIIDRVSGGESVFTNVTIDQANVRVYVAPLEFPRRGVGTETVGVIEVAQSLAPFEQNSRRLATLLGIGIVSSLVLATIVGALLARSALAPIDRVTEMARSITRAGDLTRRIDKPRTQDEVGRLVATFNEMLARIEELFRSQQRFVSDMSHELRSPLTAIRGNLDLLRLGATGSPEEREQALAAIDGELGRTQRLVADLLLLARADEGLALEKRPVEMDTLLLDVFVQAKALAHGQVKVALGSEDVAQVMGDHDKLKQLLMNLVDNAIKYTPAGGEVKLSLDCDEEWVRVSVADTGIGIPPQDLPRIFDRFYRVDKSRARGSEHAGGAGLGLGIAKWIAEAHGGRIEVQSRTNKGSTFTVWLPLLKQTHPVPD